ncbi:YggS family pyridoxal phosphate-dependent enzyme [Kocuria tytonicola]|uniref:Pyridoxal phosphate homeostasis protein n=1 Tax=Kocuria tytonicola TaxID=2055946 RepID=A0A3L9L2G4_9MICC|nr:YggS family pyridoxal phosphate-dependent enzyme [Kocuria tytonicola]RLY91157.1 YggS family pyridoxal phosphate-dependent enzyme [Kocuria tytonicola]
MSEQPRDPQDGADSSGSGAPVPRPGAPAPASTDPGARAADAPEHSQDAVPGGARRTAELAQRLSTVRRRILDAAAERPEDRAHDGALPALVVVTKFFPAQDVLRLRELGVRAVGENKDQEAGPKAREVAQALAAQQPPVSAPVWHFVGQLQSNKAKHVVRYASWVHSVDRASLVTALGRAVRTHRDAAASGDVAAGPCAAEDLTCLVQVNLDPEASREDARGGAHPDTVPGLAREIAETEGLRLGGVMAVAPREGDPREAFERLWAISQQVRGEHPEATAVSAGMSGDLEAAVAAGATHVRIGSDVLGPRPAVR